MNKKILIIYSDNNRTQLSRIPTIRYKFNTDLVETIIDRFENTIKDLQSEYCLIWYSYESLIKVLKTDNYLKDIDIGKVAKKINNSWRKNMLNKY